MDKENKKKAEDEQKEAEAADALGGDEDAEIELLKAMFKARLQEILQPCDRGVFEDYEEWVDTLYAKIEDFKDKRGFYPNIMLARMSTYRKIDKVALENTDYLVWGDEEDPSDDCPCCISCFCSEDDYRVEFCLDTKNKLKVDEFRLIFEEEPSSYVRLRPPQG